MKGKYVRKFSGLMLAILLLAGIGALAGSTAQAQRQTQPPRRVIIIRRPFFRPFFYDPFCDPWGRFDRFDYFRYQQYVFSNPEKAFRQGYKDGLKTGQGDAKNRRTYKPERSHYYYESGFGNFGEVYRQGFTKGYADGWKA